MNGIGILPCKRPQYIDHLVPLCQIMEVPILVTDPWIQDLIEIYYPPQEVILAQPEDYILDPYLQEYDLFYSVECSRLPHGSFKFLDYLCRKQARSVMSLHGNPDKYWEAYWLERLADEDMVLLYGPQLLDLLQKKAINKKAIECGNYRLEYYKAHEAFFDAKVPFKKQKTTILYAPTWVGVKCNQELIAEYSSILDVYKKVFETLSEKYQLIVKLHPYMLQTMPDEVSMIKQEYPDIFFLDEFPLIYPLLKQIDIYLGDYSSIGYDFLYFDRPLYFLETDGKTALQEYGKRILADELPCLEQKHFERKKLYSYVFGERKELKSLKQEIEDACRSSA